MSKRNAGRRGRPRKRRAADAHAPAGGRAVADPEARVAPTAGRTRGARRPPSERSSQRDPGGVGERPEAPWHPWPFSELLILVGAIGTIFGFANRDTPVLIAGLGAVALGTVEFTLREHRAGYRSHSSLLAVVPTALVHGGVALGLFALGARNVALILVPLAVDVPMFWLLFRFLRVQFEEARRERVFALRRR
jgi:hypothetical protein